MRRQKIKSVLLVLCALAWLALSGQAFADDTPPSPPGLTTTTPSTTSDGTSTTTVSTSASSTNTGPTETIALAIFSVIIFMLWQKRRQLLANKL